MTGSPKELGFKTKQEFLDLLAPYGFVKGEMKAKNNTVNILVTDSKESTSAKMKTAAKLGVEIMTYDELAELYGIESEQ